MDGTLLAATDSTVVSVDVPTDQHGRSITGVCLVFGVVGNSSAGKTRFEVGSLRLPDDMSRVKLLFDHDASDPLGYLTQADVGLDKFTGSFTIADGARGDLALTQAADKRRDGLSVGCQIDDWAFDGDVVVIKAATLSEVSLVSIPAFSDARITEVRASRKDDQIVDRQMIVTCSDPDQAPKPVESEQTVEKTEKVEQTETIEQTETLGSVTAAAPVYTAGRSGGLDLRGLTAATMSHLRSGKPASMLTAALSDIVPAGHPNLGPSKPTYVGELWEAATTPRPLMEAIGTTRLTSLKMSGFRWVQRPEVERYSGNKADIPSGPITRQVAEVAAQRFAGGWDIDRVFVDLPGGEDFLSDVFRLAVDDYRLKSEEYVAERILAEATVVPTEDAVGVTTALANLGQRFAGLGATLSFIQMSPDRWMQFVEMNSSSAPWWLQRLGNVNLGSQGGEAGGISFRVNASLPTSTILAGDKRAVKIGEIDPPIKVQALDIPRGGVDLGVFGYVAAMVTDPRAVVVLQDTTP